MPCRTYSTPTPFGPSNLCAAIDSRSTSSWRTSIATYGAACTASTWITTFRWARTRLTSSPTGWIVPTSLLASISETRIVRSLMARVELVRIDPAIAIDGQDHELEAELLEVVHRVEHRVMLDGARYESVAARLAGPGGTLEREVDRLSSAGREHELARLRVQVVRERAHVPHRARRARGARTSEPTMGCRNRR